MSRGFNTARAELFAKKNGISYDEACRRIAARPRRRRGAYVVRTPVPTLPKSNLSDLQD